MGVFKYKQVQITDETNTLLDKVTIKASKSFGYKVSKGGVIKMSLEHYKKVLEELNNER